MAFRRRGRRSLDKSPPLRGGMTACRGHVGRGGVVPLHMPLTYIIFAQVLIAYIAHVQFI